MIGECDNTTTHKTNIAGGADETLFFQGPKLEIKGSFLYRSEDKYKNEWTDIEVLDLIGFPFSRSTTRIIHCVQMF